MIVADFRILKTMQKMKFKICLFVLLAVASVAQGESFRDIEGLKEMRRDLQTEDSLMRLGILKAKRGASSPMPVPC